MILIHTDFDYNLKIFNAKTLFFVLCLLLSSCANQSLSPKLVPEDEMGLSENSAVLNLLDAAKSDLDNELYALAESKLERALRIEPQNANIWYGLARIAYMQDHFSEAKNMASRALGYASSNSETEKNILNLLKAIQTQ